MAEHIYRKKYNNEGKEKQRKKERMLKEKHEDRSSLVQRQRRKPSKAEAQN